jgi:hypothetical protein
VTARRAAAPGPDIGQRLAAGDGGFAAGVPAEFVVDRALDESTNLPLIINLMQEPSAQDGA